MHAVINILYKDSIAIMLPLILYLISYAYVIHIFFLYIPVENL